MEHKSRFYVRRKTSVPVADASILTDEGKTIEWLGRAVKLRSKFLFETTENAATATVIRALESIRAKTRVVSPKTKTLLTVAKVDRLYASWKRDGDFSKRCVRIGSVDGEQYKGDKRRVVYLTHKWKRGEHYDVFFVQDMHLKEMGHKNAEYYVVAESLAIAKDYAIEKRRKAIRFYGGLAKVSLGWLMHRVSEKSTATEVRANAKARRVLRGVNIARNSIHGDMETGEIGIYVRDGLNYAVSAVDGGQIGVNDAIKRSINGIVGQINRAFEGKQAVKGWFEKKISCPFPEVKGSNKKG